MVPKLFNNIAYLYLIFILLHVALVQAEEADPIPVYLPVNSQISDTYLDELNKASPQLNQTRFEFQKVQSWSAYQQAIRGSHKGVFLAAPHYSAWAVRKLNFVPILRIKQPLKYVVVVRRQDSHLFELSDLTGRKVCAQKPLNLDYLMLRQAFKNTIQGTRIISVDSASHEINLNLPNCDGVVISAHRFSILAKQNPDKFIRLHQSAIFNNYSFIANPNIEQAHLNRLRQF